MASRSAQEARPHRLRHELRRLPQRGLATFHHSARQARTSASRCDDPEALLGVLSRANARAFNACYAATLPHHAAALIATSEPEPGATAADACRYLRLLYGNTDVARDSTDTAWRVAFGELGRAVLLTAAEAGHADWDVEMLFEALCAEGQQPAVAVTTAPPALPPEPSPLSALEPGEVAASLSRWPPTPRSGGCWAGELPPRLRGTAPGCRPGAPTRRRYVALSRPGGPDGSRERGSYASSV